MNDKPQSPLALKEIARAFGEDPLQKRIWHQGLAQFRETMRTQGSRKAQISGKAIAS
jgi:hypothetical protein